MIIRSPGARLSAAAGYARQDKMIADIGTDHAYLPVYLIGSGISYGAVATDINRGPLERAAANVAAAGLTDRITLRLCDGLAGVESYCPRDIFILGMGGELIARILGESEMIKKEDVRLILQPMTRQAAVRGFLLSHGFCIDDEMLVEEDGRIYQIICAHYDGILRVATAAAMLVGAEILNRGGDICSRYKNRLCREFAVSAEGKRRGGAISAAMADEQLVRELLNENGDIYKYEAL